jgi:pantetheine-phosphate adenylyltransferase
VTRAVYAGSFDPITNGHLDIVQRSAKLFDELIVAVLNNPEKTSLFTPAERIELIHKSVDELDNVSVDLFDGLLVEYCRRRGASVVIRGVRAVSDFEYEFQMALMNRRLNADVETIFMMPQDLYTYLSSRLVKEVFRLGGNVAGLVPVEVLEALARKYPDRPHL